MHTPQALYDTLNESRIEIDKQIAATTEDLEKQIAVLPYLENVTVYQIKNRDGTFVLASMLAARAQILSSMAALKVASMQPKKGGTW